MPKTIPYVMVSSTSADLEAHRHKTRDAILRVGWYPEMMEHDGASPEDAFQRSLRYVDEADVYILILGFRYGSIPNISDNPGRLSYTELEYRRALERQAAGELVILSFLMDDKHPRTREQVETDPEKMPKLDALRAEVSDASKRGVSAFFTDAVTLYAEVLDALHKLSRQMTAWQDTQTAASTLVQPPDELIEAYFAKFAEPFRTRRKKDVADIAHADMQFLASTVAASLSHISLTSVGDDVLFADDDDAVTSPVEPEGDYQRADHEGKERIVNVRQKLMDFKRGVLLGQPGGGKTWTLTMLLLDYYDLWHAKHEGTLIPVFVPLNSYRGDVPFADFVRRQLGDALAPFYDALAYRLIYLCDALNEMPNQPAILPEVKAFLRDKPHFIVSCRVLDYQQKLDDLRPLEILNLRDLDLPAIRRLLATYVPASKGGDVLWQKMGGRDELFSLWDKMKAADAESHFWDASRQLRYWDQKYGLTWKEGSAREVMHSGGRLIPLCRSPFMASLLCTAFLKNQGALPATRGGLFESFITSALEDQARRDPHFPDLEAVKAALVRLAEVMQSAKVTVLPRTGDMLAADASLIDAGIAASILAGDQSEVRFQHQLFQEYFATRILLAALEADETNETNHAGQYFEPHWWDGGVWRETVVILGELAGSRAAGANRVARWLAPVTPELALTVITENGGGLTLNDLEDSTLAVVLTSARAKTAEPNPVGRAAAYRVLGLLDADDRPGIGLLPLSIAMERGSGGEVLLPDIDWVEIPGGEFIYYTDQKLTLPTFHIARYPITSAQFQCFVDAPDYDDDRWWLDMPDEQEAYGTTYRTRELSEQAYKYPNHPRERVAWYQAVAFCRWLTNKLGYNVSLPTEQQWEKAARGTDGREYPYEGDFNAAKGNTSETGIGQTTAVGIFSDGQSPYGVMDMSGNVWEWCLNKYDTPSDVGIDASGDWRVVRGGSWYNDRVGTRAVIRDDVPLPSLRVNLIGFRVCRPPSQEQP